MPYLNSVVLAAKGKNFVRKSFIATQKIFSTIEENVASKVVFYDFSYSACKTSASETINT